MGLMAAMGKEANLGATLEQRLDTRNRSGVLSPLGQDDRRLNKGQAALSVENGSDCGHAAFGDGTGKRYEVASLFSGCGGMDLGFMGGFSFLGKAYPRTSFDIVWANEINAAACDTYRRNIGEHIIEGDVRDALHRLPQHADVVIGGFPCQDISVNGKMRGISGSRSCLYTAIVEAVRQLRPKVFVAENVGGLLLKKHSQSLQTILDDFNQLGYRLCCNLYHAEDYGVPQTRERVFIVGTRNDLDEFTLPLPSVTSHLSARDAIDDLVDHEWDDKFSHVWSLAKASGQQGGRRMIAERPGYTIRAECHGNIQFHYSLPRRISMREAARIQSFPDSFLFASKLRETERQIGNAVPPVLAWHVAKAVEATLGASS
jgi:DNA (cytosine-5)-methyltransferase 1